MWVIRFLQKAYSIAFTLGIIGGLVDLTIAMKHKSKAAAEMGLVSLHSLNEQLQSGKSYSQLHPHKRQK